VKTLKLITVSILVASSLARGETIEFKTNGFYYNLNTSPEEIILKGYLINLSFKKKECNKNLIYSLHDKTIKSFLNRVLDEKDYHLVSRNGVEYKIAKASDLGKFLYNFPITAKKNKDKEAFLCRKNTK